MVERHMSDYLQGFATAAGARSAGGQDRHVARRHRRKGRDMPAPPPMLAVSATEIDAYVTVLARVGARDPPATDVFRREEIDLPRIMLEHQGHRDVVRNAGGRPPDMRTVIIDIARLAGARAASKTALPGTKKVFQGLERLNRAAKVRNAIEEIRERMGKQTETSVEP